MIWKYLVLCFIGYGIGSLNSSILVSKLYKKDVRNEGSKNAGLTNTLRVLGKKAAIMVLVMDILKGVLATGIGYLVIQDSDHGAIISGLFTVIGHIFPVFFGFKGGKGILISLSVLFCCDYRIALIGLGVFILIVAATKYVSLGSIIGMILAPFMSVVFRHDLFFIICMCVLCILTIFMHRGNIKRLIESSENKLSFKKKGDQ
ncbi:MAG: glycerol-3-phosphate 1-O-acyltransferase PlsY [Clostridia bacterium]